MIFQSLDNKSDCTGVFVDGQVRSQYDSSYFTATWSPSLHFANQLIDCAVIHSKGRRLDEVCPEELKESWKTINQRAQSFLKSFENSRINLNEVCFYDLLPEKFLLEFFGLKNDITRHVIENTDKPENHDFMYELIIMLKRIESLSLNVNIKNLNATDHKVRRSMSKIIGAPSKIKYNPWGTVTGRLATHNSSFPILTLNRELRSAIEPSNDCLLELDFNSAEIRVLLYLLGQPQPEEDIHNWISENIFDGKYTRDQSKKKVFAWLYNPKAKNKKLNEYLNRDKLYDEYYKDGHVKTPFGRSIKVGKDKAVNYLIQSTASDLFLSSAIEIDKMLRDKKSNIYFCIHDSLVLDYAREDRAYLTNIIDHFSNTKFGFFKTNLSMGKNFGQMRKIK